MKVRYSPVQIIHGFAFPTNSTPAAITNEIFRISFSELINQDAKIDDVSFGNVFIIVFDSVEGKQNRKKAKTSEITNKQN